MRLQIIHSTAPRERSSSDQPNTPRFDLINGGLVGPLARDRNGVTYRQPQWRKLHVLRNTLGCLNSVGGDDDVVKH